VLNGRHLLLLGGITVAGLLSVREGERQTGLGYRIAVVEKTIREVRAEIKLYKTEHLALQSPKAVMAKAVELHLPLAPVLIGNQTTTPTTPQVPRPASTLINRRPAPPSAPAIPALPDVRVSPINL
jgi:hypothetical protein